MLHWFNKSSTNYVSPVVYAQTKARVEQLEKAIDEYTNDHAERLRNDVENSKFEVDFSTMQVFSIERNQNGQRAYTVLGYFTDEPTEHGVTKPVVHEWTLYCSMKEHERLVTNFREWIASKGKKK